MKHQNYHTNSELLINSEYENQLQKKFTSFIVIYCFILSDSD